MKTSTRPIRKLATNNIKVKINKKAILQSIQRKKTALRNSFSLGPGSNSCFSNCCNCCTLTCDEIPRVTLTATGCFGTMDLLYVGLNNAPEWAGVNTLPGNFGINNCYGMQLNCCHPSPIPANCNPCCCCQLTNCGYVDQTGPGGPDVFTLLYAFDVPCGNPSGACCIGMPRTSVPVTNGATITPNVWELTNFSGPCVSGCPTIGGPPLPVTNCWPPGCGPTIGAITITWP